MRPTLLDSKVQIEFDVSSREEIGASFVPTLRGVSCLFASCNIVPSAPRNLRNCSEQVLCFFLFSTLARIMDIA